MKNRTLLEKNIEYIIEQVICDKINKANSILEFSLNYLDIKNNNSLYEGAKYRVLEEKMKQLGFNVMPTTVMCEKIFSNCIVPKIESCLYYESRSQMNFLLGYFDIENKNDGANFKALEIAINKLRKLTQYQNGINKNDIEEDIKSSIESAEFLKLLIKSNGKWSCKIEFLAKKYFIENALEDHTFIKLSYSGRKNETVDEIIKLFAKYFIRIEPTKNEINFIESNSSTHESVIRLRTLFDAAVYGKISWTQALEGYRDGTEYLREHRYKMIDIIEDIYESVMNEKDSKNINSFGNRHGTLCIGNALNEKDVILGPGPDI